MDGGLLIWMFGCGYGCYVVVGKCFPMDMAICGCFEVVERSLWIEIVYIILICAML